jgi:hypothetical protein
MLRQSGGNSGIGYFVLGSDAPVFSLGGDLALFAAAIRAETARNCSVRPVLRRWRHMVCSRSATAA